MHPNKKLQKRLEDNLYFSKIGFEIIHIEEDNVLLKLPYNEELLNLNGVLHGGVHATMLDWLFGMLIRVRTQKKCATLNLNMNYLRTATTKDVYARGRIVQEGYRIITVEGEVFDEEENILSKGIATFKATPELLKDSE